MISTETTFAAQADLHVGTLTKMAMLRPGGKALKIAKATVPGLRYNGSDKSLPYKAPDPRDVETRQIAAIGDPWKERSNKQKRR